MHYARRASALMCAQPEVNGRETPASACPGRRAVPPRNRLIWHIQKRAQLQIELALKVWQKTLIEKRLGRGHRCRRIVGKYASDAVNLSLQLLKAKNHPVDEPKLQSAPGESKTSFITSTPPPSLDQPALSSQKSKPPSGEAPSFP